MARIKKRYSFWSLSKGLKNTGKHLKHAGKEYTSVFAYAGCELTGQPHKTPKCTLKKGWFE